MDKGQLYDSLDQYIEKYSQSNRVNQYITLLYIHKRNSIPKAILQFIPPSSGNDLQAPTRLLLFPLLHT